jgi:hypothetical protein
MSNCGDQVCDFNYMRYVGWTESNPAVQRYYSPQTVKMISKKVTELTRGVDPQKQSYHSTRQSHLRSSRRYLRRLPSQRWRHTHPIHPTCQLSTRSGRQHDRPNHRNNHLQYQKSDRYGKGQRETNRLGPIDGRFLN